MSFTPDIKSLSSMMVGQIASLSASSLLSLKKEVDEAYSDITRKRELINNALEHKYGERARIARTEAGKDTGTIRLLDGDVEVVADLPKRVKWNQELLRGISSKIAASGDDPSEYLDVSYSVSERKFEAWPDAIRLVFAPARTLETGKPSFKLVVMGDKQ